jgi:hypothetical protein
VSGGGINLYLCSDGSDDYVCVFRMLVEMGDLPRPDPKLLMSSLFMGGASKQNGSKQSNSVAGTTGAGVGGADSEQADENRKRKIDQLQQGEDAAAADAAKIQRGRPSFI